MSHLTLITEPASSHALTTLDAVKLRLGISNTDRDAYLEAQISRASAVIENYVGRAILPQTIIERWRTPTPLRRDSLLLAYAQNITIISVEEDGLALVQDSDFELVPASGVLYRTALGFRQRWGYQIDVEYITGWATVPADLEAVCLDLISVVYTQGTRDPAIQLELTEGVGRVAYFDRGSASYAIDPAMKCALQNYVVLP